MSRRLWGLEASNPMGTEGKANLSPPFCPELENSLDLNAPCMEWWLDTGADLYQCLRVEIPLKYRVRYGEMSFTS
jgi:hypothetical protein